MEEKINRIADFCIKLTRGEVRDILDYYIPLKNYCLEHPDDSIIDDLRDVIEVATGKTLIYLKIKIKLLKAKYEKWGSEYYLPEIKELEEEYQEFYVPYIAHLEKTRHR